MTTTTDDNLIFKIKEGYILLEDLESWYAEGFVTPQDRVQIFEGNRKGVEFKIETLIHHYGPEFPFRRIPRDIQEEEEEGVDELLTETPQKLVVEVEEERVESEGEPSELNNDNGTELLLVTPKSPSESSRKSDEEAESLEKTQESPELSDLEITSETPPNPDVEANNEKAEDAPELSHLENTSESPQDPDVDAKNEKAEDSPELSHPENPLESPQNLDVETKEMEVQKAPETSEDVGNSLDSCHPEDFTKNPIGSPVESPLNPNVEAEEVEVQNVLGTSEYVGNSLDSIRPEEFQLHLNNPVESPQNFEEDPGTFYPEVLAKQQWSLGDQENFQPGYSEQQQSVCYHQQEYIPLLSVPFEPSVMISPKVLVKVIRSMSIWLQNSGKQQASEMPVNWTCEFCGIQLVSELEAFNHIISEEHLTMMNFIAPAPDLEYWKNWVLEMNSEIPAKAQTGDSKSFGQMDVSRIQEFVPQSVQAVQTLQQAPVLDPSLFVPEDFTAFPSDPVLDPSLPFLPEDMDYDVFPDDFRIPLLNPKTTNEPYLCRSEVNRILDECEKLSYHQRKYRLTENEKKLSAYCSFCSNSGRLGNKFIIYKHIMSMEHREKIKSRATWSDLKYWTEFVNAAYKKADNYNIYNSLELRPKNIPRIPLLDTPAQEKRMALKECKQRHSNLNNWVKAMKKCGAPLPESNPRMNCTCYHCPENPKLNSVWEVLLHVFDGKHFEKIAHSVEKDDFTYFDNLIKRFEFPEAVVPDTVPVATVFPRIATIVLEDKQEPIVKRKGAELAVLEDAQPVEKVDLLESEEDLEPDTVEEASKNTENPTDTHPEPTVVLLESTKPQEQEPTVTLITVEEELSAESTVTKTPADPVDHEDVKQKSGKKKPKKKDDNKKCCIQ